MDRLSTLSLDYAVKREAFVRPLRRRIKNFKLCTLTLLLLTPVQLQAAADKSLAKSQEGASALLRGRFDLAVAAYDDALKDGNMPPARQASLYSDRGVAKWRLKQLDAALSDFTKAATLNTDYAPAYNNRGNVLMQLDRVEEAYKDFDKAIALSAGFGPAYSNRANANQQLKRLDAAEEDFRKAIELMPGSAVPYNGRGKVCGALGRHYTALRYLNRAIGLNGQYGPAYENRALILVHLERYGDAIQDFDKVIALSPDKAESYVRRGQAYARDNRGAPAFKDFSQALELDGENVAALIGRGAQNIDRKRTDLALEDLNEAITLDPQNAEAYFWRAKVQQALGVADAAEKDINKAIELDPKYSEAYRVRGSFRDATVQRDAAIADYRKALELDPFSKEARDAYKAASGDTADSVVKPLAPAVTGWEVYSPASGRFVAVNERYPKLNVLLEMQGEGTAEIQEWTPLKDWLSGVGLLRYKAGQKKGKTFENVAIVDLNRNQVVTIEPYILGDTKARWDWTQNAVTVTDAEGLASTYELRKPKPVDQPRIANDDPFNIFGRSSSRGGREHRRGGIFGWLFQ